MSVPEGTQLGRDRDYEVDAFTAGHFADETGNFTGSFSIYRGME